MAIRIPLKGRAKPDFAHLRAVGLAKADAPLSAKRGKACEPNRGRRKTRSPAAAHTGQPRIRVNLRMVCLLHRREGARPRAPRKRSLTWGRQFNPWYTNALGSGHKGSRGRDPSPCWVSRPRRGPRDCIALPAQGSCFVWWSDAIRSQS